MTIIEDNDGVLLGYRGLMNQRKSFIEGSLSKGAATYVMI